MPRHYQLPPGYPVQPRENLRPRPTEAALIAEGIAILAMFLGAAIYMNIHALIAQLG